MKTENQLIRIQRKIKDRVLALEKLIDDPVNLYRWDDLDRRMVKNLDFYSTIAKAIVSIDAKRWAEKKAEFKASIRARYEIEKQMVRDRYYASIATDGQ